jgi:hypothetical protein
MTHFADHGGDGEVIKWRLYYIGLATPCYWTGCPIDIEWGGFRWIAQPITPGPATNQPDGQSATFSIADDANGTLFTMLAACNGGELATALIYEAGFLLTNKSAAPDEVLEIFAGRVDRASNDTTSTDEIEFVLMPPAQKDAGELPTRLISTLVRI